MEGKFAEEIYGESSLLSKIEVKSVSADDQEDNLNDCNHGHANLDDSVWDDSDEMCDKASDLDREWQRRHRQFHTEKQGQEGTNPPLEQPNEPLPRIYNQLLGTNNNPTKTSWPELVGETAEEAEKKIREEMTGVEIQVVPPGYFVTADFKTNRVRLYVDEANKVIRTPGTG